MDTLKLIYKILSYLHDQSKVEIFDEEHFNAEYFKCSEQEFRHALLILVEKEYVAGINVDHTKDGVYISCIYPHITLDGIEYLCENSTMKKVYKLLKGIKDIAPY